MAAVVESGCVALKNRETKIVDYVEKENKPLNGQIQKNGYVKSSANGRVKKNGYVSHHVDDEEDSFEKCTLLTCALTHIGLYILMFLGFVNQLLFKPPAAVEKNREGYAPLYNPFEQFFSRYVYRRVRHIFNRPICSTPGAELTLKERVTYDHNWTFSFTGTTRRCINLGSYNYLGFASGAGECADAAAAAARRYGLAATSPRAELGDNPLLRELERCTAEFLGVEDAVVFGMGFATNSLTLPALLGPLLGQRGLVLSDENNHASLILGLRLARVPVQVFRHNDMKHLEELARKARCSGNFEKIVVVVEGVYSMEGTVVPLGQLVRIKRRWGLHVYLDEAHSVGALGARGGGVCERAGVAPAEVDVLMGTFTKSFGAAGGYVAGSRALTSWVRACGHAAHYASPLSPPVCAQVLAAMRALATPPGRRRLRQLAANCRYFRARLRAMGCVVLGVPGSPVVPLLVYTFSKMAAVVERLAQRNVAAVGVGFPATPLNMARIRFCLSAAHTREQLDESLAAIEQVVDELGLRYSRRPRPPPPNPSEFYDYV